MLELFACPFINDQFYIILINFQICFNYNQNTEYPNVISVTTLINILLFQPHFEDMNPEYPEVEYFDADLLKDNQGLGITIAGYVGRDNAPGNHCLTLQSNLSKNHPRIPVKVTFLG